MSSGLFPPDRADLHLRLNIRASVEDEHERAGLKPEIPISVCTRTASSWLGNWEPGQSLEAQV